MMKKTLPLLLTIGLFTSAQAADIVFIVNDQTQVSTLSVADLKSYYYKQKRMWPDGTAVRFIDRGPGSEVRRTFVSKILNISNEDLELFWIGQKLYSGDSAPLQQPSQALTLQLVATLKGSISYVADGTPLPAKGVKTIKVENGGL